MKDHDQIVAIWLMTLFALGGSTFGLILLSVGKVLQ